MGICDIVDIECPFLFIQNGTVRISGRNYGDLAWYSCEDGYFVDGSELRECNDYGSWDGDPSTNCKSMALLSD